MLNFFFGDIEVICGNHKDNFSNNLICENKEEKSSYYTCPCCDNKLSKVNFNKVSFKIMDDKIDDNGNVINLLGYTWEYDNTTYKVVEDKEKIVVAVLNKNTLEIIKQDEEGGIADDECEWEKGPSGYIGYPAYYSKCCTTNSKGLEMQTHIIADWKYCPYCSKKIKVVE